MYKSIFRGSEEVARMPINEDVMFSHSIMGEHKITASFKTPSILPVQIGDYIRFKNESFYINTVPTCQKENNHLFNYDIVFEGIEYRLFDKILMQNGLSDFPYYGTAKDALQLIVDNINQIDGGWEIGEVDDTEPQHLTIAADTSCRVALTNFAGTFKLEWYLDGKIIHLVKQAGALTTLVFEYGKGKGLYGLKREYVDSKNLATKVYGYGSSKNLPLDYRGGIGRLTFDERFLTKNTDLYKIKEASFVDEEIYPKRTGTVTAVSVYNDNSATFTITDDSLDFDVSDTIVENLDAKVSFKTGELAGTDFVINKYNHSTKTFTLVQNVDSADNKLPSSVYQAAAGDQYTLIDIEMPESYITAAEQELKEKTLEYLEKASVPQVAWSLEPGLLYLRDNNIELKPGDRVTVKDADLGIDQLIRVNSISYSISFPDVLTNNTKYSITIADSIPYSVQERLKQADAAAQKDIKIVDRANAELAKRITKNFRDLKNLIPDPDEYFDVEEIKAEILETLMLSVGTKSQNFNLNNVVFKPNNEGDANRLAISAGQLIHREIEIPGLGYVWNITAANFDSLNPGLHYYVYARCSKTSLTGTWRISQTPVATEEETGYYYFNLGILYKVSNGYRDHDFTYGVTWIVGENITTGRIKSADGQSYFDLGAGSWQLGEGANYNVDEPNTLVIKEAVTSGKLIVGHAGNQNAFISGEIDNGLDSIAIGAGATYENRTIAPFRVNQRGEMFSTAGNISGFEIRDSYLIRSEDPNEDSFALGKSYAILGDYFLVRANSSLVRGDTKEFSTNLNSAIAQDNYTVLIKNTIETSWGNNIALLLDAGNAKGIAGANIALNIAAGQVAGLNLRSKQLSSNTSLTKEDVHISCYNSSNINLTLPPNPEAGKILYIRQMNDSKINFIGNGYNIHEKSVSSSYQNGDAGRGDTHMFIFDGQYWCYNWLTRQ